MADININMDININIFNISIKHRLAKENVQNKISLTI